MTISMLNKERLRRKIARTKKQVEKYDVPDASQVFTYHGGWSCGYLVGRLSVLEDLLDEIEEGEEK